MAKRSCATCLVALALLGCLLATLIEAQGKGGQVHKWWETSKPVTTGLSTSKPKPGRDPRAQTPEILKPKPTPLSQKPQYPGIPTTPVQSCDVEDTQKVTCGYRDITAHECDAIGCCFEHHQCYYGKAVTVQCTKDGQFIVVVARDATLPNLDLDSVTMLGEGYGCTHLDSNSGFAIYQFPVTSCGTLVKEESGVIIYENRMASSYEVGIGPRGAITRDTTYELLFQCRYIGNSVETLVFETLGGNAPPPVAGVGELHVVLRLGNGQCITKGCTEEEVAYGSYYTEADYPVTKVLRDDIYVDVSIVERTDHIHLTLGHCWTTTSPNPHSLPQWDLLINGCPYRDDRYMTRLVDVNERSAGVSVYPSYHKRFVFKMFTFVDQTSMVPLREQVYIHCSTTVCVANAANDCRPQCYRARRHAREAMKKSELPVYTFGPLIITGPSDDTMSSTKLN